MAVSDKKGQGWRVILTQWRKVSDILTSTLATFLLSSHPKRKRDREAHLSYYASIYNRERQRSHHLWRSLWHHSHCDVIRYWAGHAHRYRRTYVTDTL